MKSAEEWIREFGVDKPECPPVKKVVAPVNMLSLQDVRAIQADAKRDCARTLRERSKNHLNSITAAVAILMDEADRLEGK